MWTAGPAKPPRSGTALNSTGEPAEPIASMGLPRSRTISQRHFGWLQLPLYTSVVCNRKPLGASETHSEWKGPRRKLNFIQTRGGPLLPPGLNAKHTTKTVSGLCLPPSCERPGDFWESHELCGNAAMKKALVFEVGRFSLKSSQDLSLTFSTPRNTMRINTFKVCWSRKQIACLYFWMINKKVQNFESVSFQHGMMPFVFNKHVSWCIADLESLVAVCDAMIKSKDRKTRLFCGKKNINKAGHAIFKAKDPNHGSTNNAG